MTCSHTINSQRAREGGWSREKERVCCIWEKLFFSALIFQPWSPGLFFNGVPAVTYGNFFFFILCLTSVSSLHPPLQLVELRTKKTTNWRWEYFWPISSPLFPILFCATLFSVCVFVWSWENGLLILVSSLAPRLMVLAQVWSPRLDRGAFVVADGKEWSQVAHTEHALWRADGRKVKALWFLIVSHRLLGCARYPQSTSSVQELYSSISGHRFLGPETRLPKISSPYQTTTGL